MVPFATGTGSVKRRASNALGEMDWLGKVTLTCLGWSPPPPAFPYEPFFCASLPNSLSDHLLQGKMWKCQQVSSTSFIHMGWWRWKPTGWSGRKVLQKAEAHKPWRKTQNWEIHLEFICVLLSLFVCPMDPQPTWQPRSQTRSICPASSSSPILPTSKSLSDIPFIYSNINWSPVKCLLLF